jgi:hypothetical protein
MNSTVDLRNRIYRDPAPPHDRTDYIPRYGGGMYAPDDPPQAAYAHIPARRPERAPFDWGAFWLKVTAAAFVVAVWGGVIWLAARGGVRWS